MIGCNGGPPTNQRSELTAVIIALAQAFEQAENLLNNSYTAQTIFTDSRYVVGCMTEWIFKWEHNGFVNSRGVEVANRDLIEEARELDVKFDNQAGTARYVWVPRAQNQLADRAVNQELNAMEYERY